MHASFEVQIRDGEIVCCEGSTWLPSDIILYREIHYCVFKFKSTWF